MGFWDFLRSDAGPQIGHMTPNIEYIGADDLTEMLLGGQTPAQMWSSQPHLRTVVSFLARNIAQLGLHSFERDGEDRKRDRTSPFAATMRRPNVDQTAYDLVYGLVGDLALYDRAYWMTMPDAESPSGWTFRRLPPPWVTAVARDAFGAKAYDVSSTDDRAVRIPAEDVLSFTGYHPSNPRKGSPTVEALKGTLQEQIEASRYRNQVWKRGGRVSAVLERPAGAPAWSPEAREHFREDWYSKYTGRGSMAGGTPILEDGMSLNRIDFNAQEQQFVEAAKLAFATVASAFHVNPTMVGILDNANYSNVREFRRMLYGDTLGPLIAQIEDRVNTFLLPRLGMDNAAYYAEFNIAEKLQGSFEEQAAVMSTLVGRPIMTADEGRGKFNLPALGGDAASLVTPLNVLVGGQASPRDSGTQNEQPKFSPLPAAKDSDRQLQKASEPHREKVAQVLGLFFARQSKAVLSAIGAGGDWWDESRWNGELAADLLKVSHTIANILGKSQAARLGYSDGYHPDRTVEFLKVVSTRYATAINTTTKAALDKTLDGAEPDPAAVFTQAADTRGPGIAVGIGTFIAGFAAHEAAAQIAYDNGVRASKTWLTGQNPRPEHAALDGETVPIDETFSNGANWPGDDGEPGCNCSVDISIS